MATATALTRIPEFPDRLYVDLAIGTLSFDDTCWANGLDPANVQPWESDPDFQHKLLVARQAVDDDGRAFRARCRTIVQDNIMVMDGIIKDDDITASHRIDAFKTLAKFGELEPKEVAGLHAGPALSLTIIAPGGDTVSVLPGVASPVTPVKPAIEGEATEISDIIDDLTWVEVEDDG